MLACHPLGSRCPPPQRRKEAELKQSGVYSEGLDKLFRTTLQEVGGSRGGGLGVTHGEGGPVKWVVGWVGGGLDLAVLGGGDGRPSGVVTGTPTRWTPTPSAPSPAHTGTSSRTVTATIR